MEEEEAAQMLINNSIDTEGNTPAQNTPQFSTAMASTTQLHTQQEMMLKLAQSFGIDVHSPEATKNLDTFLSTPISTIGDVVKLVTNFHTAVTQVELKSHAMKVEAMLDIFGDKIVSMHKELEWLGKEQRNSQRQRASTQIMLSGWPKTATQKRETASFDT